ncbi:MAG: D-alanyl-D-alanine carboxypeptidase [Blastocatellia bacterium]|nr:D-alanyl-D-alanine carboxypeptidase [Blastocatellia bacterium]
MKKLLISLALLISVITLPIDSFAVIRKSTKRSRAKAVKAEMGVYAETLKGETIVSNNEDRRFNPASVIKVATSIAAMRIMGHDYRFKTTVQTDATIDSSGLLTGNLYIVSSGDPVFFTEHAFLISEKIREAGIKAVQGDLVVTNPFYFNFSSSHAGDRLRAILERTEVEDNGLTTYHYPPITFYGNTRLEQSVKGELFTLYTHYSKPMIEILKSMNDYSNNFIAEVIGYHLGGSDVIEKCLIDNVGLSPAEVRVVSSSGLGQNAITARASTKMVRHLYYTLSSINKRIDEILPVAGVDNGTLLDRFNQSTIRGSVVGKTGTLAMQHVSTLVGVIYTKDKGVVLFAILNHDLVHKARIKQDEIVNQILEKCGGALPLSLVSYKR